MKEENWEHQEERKSYESEQKYECKRKWITAGKNEKWYNLSRKLAFSYKIKHAITIRLKNCTLGIPRAEKLELTFYTKTIYMDVHNIITLNTKNHGEETNILPWLSG